MNKSIAFVAIAAFLPGLANAADAFFSGEGAFTAAAGATSIESFEGLGGSLRSTAPVSTPLLTINTLGALIGINTGPNTPQDGFGASATDGTHYFTAYRKDLPTGTIRIDLAAPSTVFGFNISDLGETAGTLRLLTSAGAYAGGITLATFAGTSGNGLVEFYGITQTQAFTQVIIEVSGVDEAYGLDKLYVSVVPEPAAAALWLAGLGGLAWARRRALR